MLVQVGAPSLSLRVAVSEPEALLAVRLCAVDPVTGASLLLTRGCLNLTQLRSSAWRVCGGGGSAKFYNTPRSPHPTTPLRRALRHTTLHHTTLHNTVRVCGVVYSVTV